MAALERTAEYANSDETARRIIDIAKSFDQESSITRVYTALSHNPKLSQEIREEAKRLHEEATAGKEEGTGAGESDENIKLSVVIKPDDKREVAIVKAEKEHGFKNFKETTQWAKENIVGEYENPEIGSVNISNQSIGKYLSKKAVGTSLNIDIHLSTLKVIPSVIENSVVGEIHEDKKGDVNIRDIVRLYGCVDIDGTLYRVKSTVKRYVNDNEKTKAYSYEVTEIELLEGETNDAQRPRPNSTSNSIPVANLVNNPQNDKGNEKRFSITPEQDQEYLDAVERGDMEKAQDMVNEAAKEMGYSSNSDYQGESSFNGSAPSAHEYYATPEESLEAWENEEYEGSWSVADEFVRGIAMGDLVNRISEREYKRGNQSQKESIQALREAKEKVDNGEKNPTVKVYCSVPKGVKEGRFRNGDWVTLSKSYAEENARVHSGYEGGENEEAWNGDGYNIIEMNVPIEDIWWDGNDINEFGYDNGQDMAYKNAKNNAKLLAPVTYDDNGNVIPLSERFNEKKEDVRYSVVGNIEEAKSYIENILETAEGMLLPKSYESINEFKQDFIEPVETPIKLITVGEGVIKKIYKNNRVSISGALKPTLKNPDFILRDVDGSDLYI